MDLHTVFCKSQSGEVIPDKGHHQTLFQNQILGKTSQRQRYLNTSLIAVPDKVQHRHIWLVIIFAKTSPELLDEDGRGFCRAKE